VDSLRVACMMLMGRCTSLTLMEWSRSGMSWRPRAVTGMFSRRSGRGVAQVVKHALDLAFFFFSFPYFSNINQIQKIYIYNS
jgi:hypothetical protein